MSSDPYTRDSFIAFGVAVIGVLVVIFASGWWDVAGAVMIIGGALVGLFSSYALL